ncbi:MAG TPA: HD domain-containing protein, partial [Acidobacteria bacterium]|nr:HD domain-containing protein [Acidobacteriota bacterium]
LCRELKANESTTRIPIIILTVDDSEEQRIACLEAGADDFMLKPGSRSEIGARARALLRAKTLSDRLLISYHELDRLGDFAERFVNRSAAEWSRVEVAEAMARHVLGGDDLPGHRPALLWAVRRIGERFRGGCWRRVGHQLDEIEITVPAASILHWLDRHPPGHGAHIVKGTIDPATAQLLGLPEAAGLSGVVALYRNDNLLIAAGYPWEVGTYELALLRAMHRHWDAFERIRREARHTERAFFLTMDALALAAEFYQHGTAAHIQRVGALSAELARLDGAAPRFVRWIAQSAKLHDVGKITIPLELLMRDDDLTEPDVDRLKRHTIDGERLLAGAEHLEMARHIARHHHECWDGSGYPDGLSGEEIPYEARIVKLTDVYDALRSERAYKPALSHREALKILAEGDQRVRPDHFDPRLLRLFLDNAELIEARRESAASGNVPGDGPRDELAEEGEGA